MVANQGSKCCHCERGLEAPERDAKNGTLREFHNKKKAILNKTKIFKDSDIESDKNESKDVEAKKEDSKGSKDMLKTFQDCGAYKNDHKVPKYGVGNKYDKQDFNDVYANKKKIPKKKPSLWFTPDIKPELVYVPRELPKPEEYVSNRYPYNPQRRNRNTRSKTSDQPGMGRKLRRVCGQGLRKIRGFFTGIGNKKETTV